MWEFLISKEGLRLSTAIGRLFFNGKFILVAIVCSLVEAEKVSWVKCSPEEYALLLKVRDGIVSVKTNYRGWEKIRDLALKAGNFEAAEVYNAIMKRRLEELKFLEKEVAELEAACFDGEK